MYGKGRKTCAKPVTATPGRRSGGAVVLALPGAVPGADPGDVGGHVVAQVERGANPDDPLRIVEVRWQNGDVRGFGDLPETRFPAFDRLAGALGRQSEPEFVSTDNPRRHLFGHALARRAA